MCHRHDRIMLAVGPWVDLKGDLFVTHTASEESGFDCGAGDVAGRLMALELMEANAEDDHDF